MTGASHVWLLFISLMFPLVGFLAGATLADQLLLSDLKCAAFSGSGMAFGFLVCKLASSMFFEKDLIERLIITEV